MALHKATARRIMGNLQAADRALERLEDSINVALADLPAPDEYRTLTNLAAALIVVRAALHDHLTQARLHCPRNYYQVRERSLM
jgi:hypothetical protein